MWNWSLNKSISIFRILSIYWFLYTYFLRIQQIKINNVSIVSSICSELTFSSITLEQFLNDIINRAYYPRSDCSVIFFFIMRLVLWFILRLDDSWLHSWYCYRNYVFACYLANDVCHNIACITWIRCFMLFHKRTHCLYSNGDEIHFSDLAVRHNEHSIRISKSAFNFKAD